MFRRVGGVTLTFDGWSDIEQNKRYMGCIDTPTHGLQGPQQVPVREIHGDRETSA